MYKLSKIKNFFLNNKDVLLLVVGWLVVLNLFALVASNRFNLKSDNAYDWVDNGRYTQDQSWNITKLHSRWDSNWYLDIASTGYKVDENNTLSNIVFLPIYPYLIKSVSYLFNINLIFSGWITSISFLFLACLYLFKLVRDFHKEINPLNTVFLLLIFPTAFFLNAVYTESLFLFLSLASFYYAKKRNYLAAGAFGFLASLTRISGILLFIPLLMEFFQNKNYVNKKHLTRIIPLFFVPVGAMLFFAFHWMKFGDPLLFFKVESAWGRSFNFNAEHFAFISRAAITNFSLDIFYLIFILAIIILLIRKRMYSYAVYVASTIVVAVSSGTLMSIGRYILVLFPIYIIGASLKNEISKKIWIVVSILLFALNTILFVNWYWAG